MHQLQQAVGGLTFVPKLIVRVFDYSIISYHNAIIKLKEYKLGHINNFLIIIHYF